MPSTAVIGLRNLMVACAVLVIICTCTCTFVSAASDTKTNVVRESRLGESVRFCCKREVLAFGDDYCENGFIYLGKRPAGKIDIFSTEILLEILIVVVSNAAYLPTVYKCWRASKMYESMLGFGLAITSTLYHFGDTIDRRILGMNPGQWHRLDNDFSILIFQALAILWMDLKDRSHIEAARWGGLLITLVLQEASPWDALYTVLPILIMLVPLLYKIVFIERSWSDTKSRFNHNFGRGCLFQLIATSFFILGLNENQDYLRFYHGMWHFWSGIASIFWVDSVNHEIDEAWESKKLEDLSHEKNP